MSHSQVIPDIFEDIVGNMIPAPAFAFGYWPEISNGLRLQGLVKVNDGHKYPLIALHSSITESKGVDPRYLAEINCKFILITETVANYSTQNRIDNVYTPILYPLYASFLEALRTSHYFDLNQKDKLGEIKHEKQDLYFMGSEKANQNQISDIVDAIELTFKNLKVRKFTY